ncbi:mechanosensitive ion channel family protein [Clostridium thermosuccinogenes]|uniref:mechanosensitive ion channel family protein n=1 Tax=Clostridium thermosuccinogenes TaxID=84032 RepID=UPI001FA91246|nr:mechanosensitive ion channel family protein [Pseudoclostridium thermosuccinogenes]
MNSSLEEITGKLTDILGTRIFNALANFLSIILIILASIVIVRIGGFLIRKFFEKQKAFKYNAGEKKIDTITTLVISIFKYAVYILAGVIILSDRLGMKSVLATAGIGGVAIGLGAQSLISDVISGFFIVMEDQYGVGDTITVDSLTGTVEQMELRVTRLRNTNGDLYIIPNSQIKKVINHTRGNKAVIVDIPVAYSSDINKAFDAVNNVCRMVKSQFDIFTEEPKLLGITNMDKSGMVMRVIAKTLPNEQWEVERRIRKLVKEEFEKQGLQF